MLDEKSRALLDYSKPNDIIIITPPDNKAKTLFRSCTA